MKKFILLTLLASGLSAHAMPGGNQENGGQSKEGAHSTIAQQRQARVQRMRARETVEGGRAEGENQAQVAQGTQAEDLNQRSAFEEDEVAPAPVADAQEVQRDTMPRPAVSQAQAAQDNAVGAVERQEQAQAEREQAQAVQQAPAAEDLNQRSEDEDFENEWDRAVTNLLDDIDRENEENMARIEKKREEHRARVDLLHKSNTFFQKSENRKNFIDRKSTYVEGLVNNQRTNPVDEIQIDTFQRNYFNQRSAFEEDEAASAANPQEVQIDTVIQSAMTNSCKAVVAKVINSNDLIRNILSYLYTDATNIAPLLEMRYFQKNPLLNIQPILAFNSDLSTKNIVDIMQKIEERKANKPVKTLVLGPQVTLNGEPLTLQDVFKFQAVPTSVTIDLISDEWATLMGIYDNSPPSFNFTINKENMLYFKNVLPKKISLTFDEDEDEWEDVVSFFDNNQDFIDPKNVEIAMSIKLDIDKFVQQVGDIRGIRYLTDVESINGISNAQEILDENFILLLQNNASTISELNMCFGGLDDEAIIALASYFQYTPNLESLILFNNYMSDVGVNALIRGLQYIPNLESLNVSHNNISEEGKTTLRTICREKDINLDL